MTHQVLLSVVMVVQGWSDRIDEVVADVARHVQTLVSDYEVILVDNGSSGDSVKHYRAMTQANGQPNVQVYRLLNEVQQEVAAWAGVENSLGDHVLVYDPFHEGLDPLPQALDAVARGCEVVLLVNSAPHLESGSRRMLRRGYGRLFKMLGGVDLPVEASQFRLISKRVVSYLLQQPRPAARYRTSPAVAGFSTAVIHYVAPRRATARVGLRRQARRALGLLVSNTTALLRITSTLGLAGAVLNMAYSIYVLVIALTRSNVAAGWTTLSLQQSGMFFLFSLIIFVLTEYAIDHLRNARTGSAYFLIDEMTSAVLTRRERLNVETQGRVIPRETPDGVTLTDRN
jgi:polyisoprenyl-phosphate glycosyltransferase